MGSVAETINAHSADLVGVAVSATFSQIAFARHLDINFPLLSDWDGAVSGAFGVRYDIWKGHVGLAKRALFLIDGEGKIRYSWSTDNAEELPQLEPMLATLYEIP